MKIFDIETNKIVDVPVEYEKNCIFGVCTEYSNDAYDIKLKFNNNTIESVIKTTYASKNDCNTILTEDEYFYDNDRLVKHTRAYDGSTSLDVEKFQYFESGNLQMYTCTDRYGKYIEKAYYDTKDTKYDVCLMPTLHGKDICYSELTKNINSTDIEFVNVFNETNVRCVYLHRRKYEEAFEFNNAGYLTYRTHYENSDNRNICYSQTCEYDENNKLILINNKKYTNDNTLVSTHQIVYE